MHVYHYYHAEKPCFHFVTLKEPYDEVWTDLKVTCNWRWYTYLALFLLIYQIKQTMSKTHITYHVPEKHNNIWLNHTKYNVLVSLPKNRKP